MTPWPPISYGLVSSATLAQHVTSVAAVMIVRDVGSGDEGYAPVPNTHAVSGEVAAMVERIEASASASILIRSVHAKLRLARKLTSKSHFPFPR